MFGSNIVLRHIVAAWVCDVGVGRPSAMLAEARMCCLESYNAIASAEQRAIEQIETVYMEANDDQPKPKKHKRCRTEKRFVFEFYNNIYNEIALAESCAIEQIEAVYMEANDARPEPPKKKQREWRQMCLEDTLWSTSNICPACFKKCDVDNDIEEGTSRCVC